MFASHKILVFIKLKFRGFGETFNLIHGIFQI
jgi:hypothetical protein